VGNSVLIEQSGLYLGNAFLLLPRVRPGTVRLVLSDPPYNVSRENNLETMGRRGIDFEWDHGFDQTGWLHHATNALMPGGSIVIWNDWKNLGEVADKLQDLGLDVKRDLHWIKDNPLPRNRDRSFVQAVESALWAVKPGGRWVFNRRPELGYENGVFRHAVVRDKLHPSKKPDPIFRALIEILSNPGDLVLDPFAGVFTTAINAQATGRRHISFELREDYFEEGARRLQVLLDEQKLSLKTTEITLGSNPQ